MLFTSKLITAEVSTSCTQNKWFHFNDTFLTCEIRNQNMKSGSIVIISSRDTSIKGFVTKNKKNVDFIPTNVAEIYPSLIAFEVFNCSLKSVSGNMFRELPDLRYLNLARNKIEAIESKVFQNQAKLEKLALGWNQIDFIDFQAFNSLTSLKNLYLHDNKIQSINENHFFGLENLENVNFDRNRIKVLNWDGFSRLRNLKKISFTSNNIETVRFSLVIQNERVEKIWLNENKIQYLDYHLFKGMRNLYFLNLLNNTCISKLYNNNDHSEIIKDLESELTAKRCNIHSATSNAGNIFNCHYETVKKLFVLFGLWKLIIAPG